MPLTILAILMLFFIPLFQYSYDLHAEGVEKNDKEEQTTARRMMKAMVWLNFLLAIFFGLEIAMKSYAFGLRRAFSNMEWVFKAEFFIQPILWVSFLLFLTNFDISNEYNTQVILFSMTILIRVLRVTQILNEVTLWRNFVRTLRALMKPFFNFGATLYSLYLIYASIGLEFFGGKINQEFVQKCIDEGYDVDASWVYLNFNDFVMSLNTLFSLMWVNDWEKLVYMYEQVYHDQKDTAVITYFVTFIELANLIFINIIIAFIIDTYQSIDLTLKAE